MKSYYSCMLSFRDYMSLGGWWFNTVFWVTVPLLSLLANNKMCYDRLAKDDFFFSTTGTLCRKCKQTTHICIAQCSTGRGDTRIQGRQ